MELLTLAQKQTQFSADHCIKCNICTAACPVAAVTDLFPGPKAVGPQMQRLRHPNLNSPDASVSLCSGCGTCTLVCPHGVQIAEMNTIAKAEVTARDGMKLRDRLLARPAWMGRLGGLVPGLANAALNLPLARRLTEAVLGISRHAPLPRFRWGTFRGWFKHWQPQQPARQAIGQRKVVYFHGCSTNYFEHEVGQAAVAVLAHNGCKVSIAQQNCCGLPLQSNGDFAGARHLARENIRKLAPYVKENYIIVGTSTSCTLALKHDYRAILGLSGADVDLVAENTYDFFEFLALLAQDGQMNTRFRSLNETLFYHAPCQQRSHFIGQPAADLLRRVPGLRVVESTAMCCGVAGTYGLKAEKYDIALAVGQDLFAQQAAAQADGTICDSETCRWWLDAHTGSQSQHPVMVLARAYGLPAGGRK